jgi:hypothetical protein
MIVLTLVALGAAGYLSAALVREHGSPVRSVFVTSWIAAGVIALARLVVLFSSPFFLGAHHSQPIELLLFLLFMANGAFEVRLLSVLSGEGFSYDPALPIVGLIALTSIPVGFVWAWICSRPRSVSAM